METKPSVDLLLIKKFQKISDWSQDWFGINCFALARFFRNLMIVAYAAKTLFTFLKGADGFAIIISINSLFITFSVCYALYFAEKSVKNNPVFTNPAVIRFATFRMLWRIIMVLALFIFFPNVFDLMQPSQNDKEMYGKWKDMFWSLADIFIFFTLYFGACTPKPHKPSKVRKLIEKAKYSIGKLGKSPVLRPAYISPQ